MELEESSDDADMLRDHEYVPEEEIKSMPKVKENWKADI